MALHWSDIDLKHGSLFVRSTLHRTSQGTVFDEPKSAASRRTLELPAFAVQILRQHKISQDKEREDAGSAWLEGDLVFATPTGTPLDHSNLRRSSSRF